MCRETVLAHRLCLSLSRLKDDLISDKDQMKGKY